MPDLILNGKPNTALEIILSSRIIAIARGVYGEELVSAVKAIYEGGVRAVEVTFEQGNDPRRTRDAIEALINEFGGRMAIGAGTVMSEAELDIAYRCGAQYVVSPNTDEGVIRKTKRLGLVSIPGAMTPTEIAAAASFGADIVKVFPAGALGPEYFKAVTTPLRHIRCAAVAGVTLDNIKAFQRAGACAFGVSSSILDNRLIRERRFEELKLNAAAFISALNADRT